MHGYNVDWESYEYTVKDIDVYNDCTYAKHYENNENSDNYEHNENENENNEHNENEDEIEEHNENENENEEHNENKNENNRKKIIEEITKEIISSYVNYLVHDCNKSDYTDHEDFLESDSEDDEEEEYNEDVKSLEREDVIDEDSDEDVIDEDVIDEDSDEDVYKKNTKILLNCCTLYIVMLSIYVNTILSTYIILRC